MCDSRFNPDKTLPSDWKTILSHTGTANFERNLRGATSDTRLNEQAIRWRCVRHDM